MLSPLLSLKSTFSDLFFIYLILFCLIQTLLPQFSFDLYLHVILFPAEEMFKANRGLIHEA